MLVVVLVLLTLALSVYPFVAMMRAPGAGGMPSVDDMPIRVRAAYIGAVVSLLGVLIGLTLVFYTWSTLALGLLLLPSAVTAFSVWTLVTLHGEPAFGRYQVDRSQRGLPPRKWWQWPTD